MEISEEKAFYEQEYERSERVAIIPNDDDLLYAQVLAELKPLLKPDLKVLDLGCNNGILSFYMAQNGCDVSGIDLAKNAVQCAQSGAAHHNLPNTQFQQMDFLAEWQKEAAFDLALCSHVIEHIPDDSAFIQKIAFALKPGGRLMLLTPTPHSLLYRLYRATIGRYPFDERVGHLRRYNREDGVAVIEQAGLKIESIQFMDALVREICFALRPLKWAVPIMARIRPLSRAINKADTLAAKKMLFPASICIIAKKPI